MSSIMRGQPGEPYAAQQPGTTHPRRLKSHPQATQGARLDVSSNSTKCWLTSINPTIILPASSSQMPRCAVLRKDVLGLTSLQDRTCSCNTRPDVPTPETFALVKVMHYMSASSTVSSSAASDICRCRAPCKSKLFKNCCINCLSKLGDSHAVSGKTTLPLGTHPWTSAFWIARAAWKPHKRRDGRARRGSLSLPSWMSCHRMLFPELPEMYCCLGSSRKGGYRTWTCSSRNTLTGVFPSSALAVGNALVIQVLL